MKPWNDDDCLEITAQLKSTKEWVTVYKVFMSIDGCLVAYRDKLGNSNLTPLQSITVLDEQRLLQKIKLAKVG